MIKRTFLFMGLALGMALTGCGNASTSAQSPTSANAGNAGAQSPGTEYVAQDAKGIQTMTVRTTRHPRISRAAGAHRAGPDARGARVRAGRRADHGDEGASLGPRGEGANARGTREQRPGARGGGLSQGAGRQPGEAESNWRARRICSITTPFPSGNSSRRRATRSRRRRKWRRRASRFRFSAWTRTTRRRNLLVKAPRSGVILDVGAAPGEFSQALSAPAPLCNRRGHHHGLGRGRYLRKGSRRGEIGRSRRRSR